MTRVKKQAARRAARHILNAFKWQNGRLETAIPREVLGRVSRQWSALHGGRTYSGADVQGMIALYQAAMIEHEAGQEASQ